MSVVAERLAPARRSATLTHRDVVPLVFGLTVPAVVAELVILRLFTRTAIHIPALEFLAGTYRVAAVLGRFTFHLAAVLLIAALSVLVVELARRVDPQARTAAAATAVFGVTAAAARLELIDTVTTTVLVGTCVAVLVWTAASGRGISSVPLILFGAAFLAVAAHSLAQQVAAEGGPAVDGARLLYLGEGLALAAAASAPLIIGVRPSRRAVWFGAAAGVLVAGAMIGNGSTVKILTLWNFGLAGYFPSPLYGIAVAGVVVAVATAHRLGRRFDAWALVLLFVGAVGLHSTYQSGLVVAGLSLLVYLTCTRRPSADAADTSADALGA